MIGLYVLYPHLLYNKHEPSSILIILFSSCRDRTSMTPTQYLLLTLVRPITAQSIQLLIEPLVIGPMAPLTEPPIEYPMTLWDQSSLEFITHLAIMGTSGHTPYHMMDQLMVTMRRPGKKYQNIESEWKYTNNQISVSGPPETETFWVIVMTWLDP